MFKWYCNDFLISLLVSDFQRSVWSVPSISVAVLGLVNFVFSDLINTINMLCVHWWFFRITMPLSLRLSSVSRHFWANLKIQIMWLHKYYGSKVYEHMIHDFMSDKATTGFVSCPLEKRKKKVVFLSFLFFFLPWWVGVQFRVICLKLNLFPVKYVISSMLSYHCSSNNRQVFKWEIIQSKSMWSWRQKGHAMGEMWRKGGVGVSFCYFVHLGVVLKLRWQEEVCRWYWKCWWLYANFPYESKGVILPMSNMGK